MKKGIPAEERLPTDESVRFRVRINLSKARQSLGDLDRTSYAAAIEGLGRDINPFASDFFVDEFWKRTQVYTDMHPNAPKDGASHNYRDVYAFDQHWQQVEEAHIKCLEEKQTAETEPFRIPFTEGHIQAKVTFVYDSKSGVTEGRISAISTDIENPNDYSFFNILQEEVTNQDASV